MKIGTLGVRDEGNMARRAGVAGNARQGELVWSFSFIWSIWCDEQERRHRQDKPERHPIDAGLVCLIYLVCLGYGPREPDRPEKPNGQERRGLKGSRQVLNPMRRDFGAGSAMSSRMASKTIRNWPSYFFSSSLRRRASPLFEAISSRS